MQKWQNYAKVIIMNTYFENELSYHGLSVYFGNNPKITDREIHTYYEVMFYMDTDTFFLTEEGQQPLKNNTLLIMPKETYHFIKLDENKSFLRLKISIPESLVNTMPIQELLSQIRVIEKPTESVIGLINQLQLNLKQGYSKKRSFYAYSVVLLILAELNLYDSTKTIAKTTKETNVITHILDYISIHLEEDLTIGMLSDITSYSPSSITHLFKKELGISLHKYITMRRLIHARNLIKNNSKISGVHLLCGYRDYSSFYKAYTKYFGYPPSSEKDKS